MTSIKPRTDITRSSQQMQEKHLTHQQPPVIGTVNKGFAGNVSMRKATQDTPQLATCDAEVPKVSFLLGQERQGSPIHHSYQTQPWKPLGAPGSPGIHMERKK